MSRNMNLLLLIAT